MFDLSPQLLTFGGEDCDLRIQPIIYIRLGGKTITKMSIIFPQMRTFGLPSCKCSLKIGDDAYKFLMAIR